MKRTCKGCGATEKFFLGGLYTNFALGGYCADCITRAGEQLRKEESMREVLRTKMIYSVGARSTTPPERKYRERSTGNWYIKKGEIAYPGRCIVEQLKDSFWGGEESETFTSKVLTNPTWGELFRLSDKAMHITRDYHHQFFEGIYRTGERDVDHETVPVLRFSLGS